MPFSKWFVSSGYFAILFSVCHEKKEAWMISHGETLRGIYAVKSRNSNTF